MQIPRVKSASVWKSVRILFIGSGLLFLINILFGFDNAFVVGDLARGNQLIHLHAGSLGWITLSAIGIAVWMASSSRQLSTQYERRIRLLTWVSVFVFAGYIPNFWLAFSLGQTPFLPLLPIFGSLTVLLLWVMTIFIFAQFKEVKVLETIHLLIASALLVSAIGGTVGMLLGLERVIGRFLPLPEADRVAAHAAMMDSYLFLLVGAIVEWFTNESQEKWSYAGLAQALAWTFGAAIVPIAFFTGMVAQLVPLFVVLMVIGLVIFLVRIGWRAMLIGPMAERPRAWIFFSSLWLVIYMLLFLFLAAQSGAGQPMPEWFMPVFAHSGYVGMVTTGLLAIHSTRGGNAADQLAWGDSVSLWLINLGLLVFIVPRIAIGSRLGAIVMGLGVLLGVVTVQRRLWASDGSSKEGS